jgi:hypothetical protein
VKLIISTGRYDNGVFQAKFTKVSEVIFFHSSTGCNRQYHTIDWAFCSRQILRIIPVSEIFAAVVFSLLTQVPKLGSRKHFPLLILVSVSELLHRRLPAAVNSLPHFMTPSRTKYLKLIPSQQVKNE